MKTLKCEKNITFMSKDNLPEYHINPNEIFVVETLDCFSGEIRESNQLLKNLKWDLINPATGPIYIDGAKPGDVLKISILDIKVGNRAVVLYESEDIEKYDFKEKNEKSLFVNIDGENAIISNNVKVPINPMIGVIGTAPKNDKIPTTLPGLHGGNMDNTHITAGSIVYLPVNQDGALLAIGDLHALMGDGESTGSGLEINGNVTLKIEILKNTSMPLPMVENDKVIETVASAETLDEASILAVKNMLIYLSKNIGLRKEEAWKLVTACGNVGVCQFANSLKTVRCVMPKKVINL